MKKEPLKNELRALHSLAKGKILLLAAAMLSRCTPCPAGVVADTLWHEARGEGRQGLEAVASVIWNRSQNKRMPLEAVCFARKQFSCHNEGYTKPRPRNELERGVLAFCEGIERQMESGAFRPTVRATQYFAGKKPYWYGDFRVEKVIGNHVFMVKK